MLSVIYTCVCLVLVMRTSMAEYCNYTFPSCECADFESFAQVDLSECDPTSCQTLDLKGSRDSRLVLNNDILSLLPNFSPRMFMVFIYDLAGIDLQILRDFNSSYLPLQKALSQLGTFRYVRLDFNLYLDGKPLQISFDKNAESGRRCNESLFVNMFDTHDNIFNLNTFNFHLLDTRFSSEYLCPFIFQHTRTECLSVYGNQLQLDPTDYSNLNTLETNIGVVKILFSYKLNLDKTTLHPVVFGQSTKDLLYVTCSLNKIETHVFKSFIKLRRLFLNLNNLRYVIHTNGIEWMSYLNSRLTLADFDKPTADSFFELLFQSTLNDDYLWPRNFFPYLEYTFPNEDFCLFQNFPHNRLIVPFISPTKPINCTCTVYSLVKNYPFYYNNLSIINIQSSNVWYCFSNDSALNWLGEKNCTLTCNTSSQHLSYDYQGHYFDLYDLKNQFVLFKDWLFILGPVVCTLGLISNLFVIFTIKCASRVAKDRSKPSDKKTRKHTLIDPKQPFFIYMLTNAIINLISSILFLFYYSIRCNNKMSGIRGTVERSCLIESLAVNILASILKLLSNFTFLQMSLNRYVLVGKDHYKFLISFANLKIRKYVGWGLAVSSALSVIVYYQQEFFSSSFNGRVFSESYYYNDYFWYGFQPDYEQTKKIEAHNITVSKLEQLPYLSGFTMVHDLFSYFLFCVLTTVIDAMTVIRLRRVLSQKKQMLGTSTTQDKADEIEKSEKKSIAMIVLNSLTIFILRSPELLAVVFFYDLMFNQNSDYTFKMFCYSYRQCLAVLDFSNIFYLLSLSLNFVFYYFFNLSFKVAFIEAAGLLKKILKLNIKKSNQ